MQARAVHRDELGALRGTKRVRFDPEGGGGGTHDGLQPAGVVRRRDRPDPPSDAQTVVALRAAARAALPRGAPDSAIRYLRRALAEPPEPAAKGGAAGRARSRRAPAWRGRRDRPAAGGLRAHRDTAGARHNRGPCLGIGCAISHHPKPSARCRCSSARSKALDDSELRNLLASPDPPGRHHLARRQTACGAPSARGARPGRAPLRRPGAAAAGSARERRREGRHARRDDAVGGAGARRRCPGSPGGGYRAAVRAPASRARRKGHAPAGHAIPPSHRATGTTARAGRRPARASRSCSRWQADAQRRPALDLDECRSLRALAESSRTLGSFAMRAPLSRSVARLVWTSSERGRRPARRPHW
jgi:hypothetical protein